MYLVTNSYSQLFIVIRTKTKLTYGQLQKLFDLSSSSNVLSFRIHQVWLLFISPLQIHSSVTRMYTTPNVLLYPGYGTDFFFKDGKRSESNDTSFRPGSDDL